MTGDRSLTRFTVRDTRYIVAVLIVGAMVVAAAQLGGEWSRTLTGVLILLGAWQAVILVAWALRPLWRRITSGPATA